MLAIVALCGWEWTSLIPLSRSMNKGLFILLLLSFTLVNGYCFPIWLGVGLVLWLGIVGAILTYPRSQTVWGNPGIVGGMGLCLVPLFANSLAEIYHHAQGKNYIVYLLCLVWAADIGAYMFGKSIGHRKLIPAVSPGKTIEGALGGLILTLFVAVGGYFYFKPESVVIWFLLAIGINVISMFGDLSISMLKRRTKLKDTGFILPGHGGILDRLDSLIAAAPVFYFGLNYLRP
jgi:CDP-diglyceride synthetase